MNKTSLKLGGNTYSDELQLMAEKLDVKSFCCEFNVIDNFWTARVTSIFQLKKLLNTLQKKISIKPIKLINEVMELNGVKSPRVAVQALNPHAEFGTEEKDEIIPAIEEAKKLGFNADGPYLVILLLLLLIKIKTMIVWLACTMMHFNLDLPFKCIYRNRWNRGSFYKLWF